MLRSESRECMRDGSYSHAGWPLRFSFWLLVRQVNSRDMVLEPVVFSAEVNEKAVFLVEQSHARICQIAHEVVEEAPGT